MIYCYTVVTYVFIVTIDNVCIDKKVSKRFEWKETETTAPKLDGEFQIYVFSLIYLT